MDGVQTRHIETLADVSACGNEDKRLNTPKNVYKYIMSPISPFVKEKMDKITPPTSFKKVLAVFEAKIKIGLNATAGC